MKKHNRWYSLQSARSNDLPRPVLLAVAVGTFTAALLLAIVWGI